MTQKALGEAVGVSQAAIQKIETGRAAQTTKLLDIANALRVRPEWLSSGTGAMSADSVKVIKIHHAQTRMYSGSTFWIWQSVRDRAS